MAAYAEVSSIRQSPIHYSFRQGIRAGGAALDELISLKESSGKDLVFPTINDGETFCSAMGEYLEQVAPNHHILFSLHGRSGKFLSELWQGGSTGAFEEGIAQFKAGRDIAQASGKQHRIPGIVVIHGQGDSVRGEGEIDYFAAQVEWQQQYSRALGQNVPFFVVQCSEWTIGNLSTPKNNVPQAQLNVSLQYPEKFSTVCPLYFVEHAADGIHLSAKGQQTVGKYLGKVYHKVVIQNQPWKPLYPTVIARSGNVIVVQFHVPVGNLQFDTTAVTNPENYGFTYTDDSGNPPSISSVEVTASNAVTLTLSAVPTGTNKRIQYAWKGTPGAAAGPTTGARGCLRDTDELPNWCVHFNLPLT